MYYSTLDYNGFATKMRQLLLCLCVEIYVCYSVFLNQELYTTAVCQPILCLKQTKILSGLLLHNIYWELAAMATLGYRQQSFAGKKENRQVEFSH
jgi:hypothetical protein